MPPSLATYPPFPGNLPTLEAYLAQMETDLIQRNFVVPGHKILILGGIPMGKVGGTNFIKIHTLLLG